MIVSISRASFLFCSLRRLRLIFYLEEILAQGGMKGKFPAFSNKPGRYCIDEELPREGGTGRFIGSPENHLPEDWIRDLPQIRRMRTEAGRPLARGQQGDESNYSDAQSPPPPSTHTWFHPRLVGSEIELVNTMHINILTNKNKLTRVIIEAKCHFVDLNHDIRNFPLVKIKIRIWGKA